MALKLYGHKWSLCTRRVLLVLAEKEVEFEFHTVDFMAGEQKKSPYIEKQPFGVIPLLEDGSFTLYESRAIGRYLAAKYQSQGTPLTPAPGDVRAWALFEQWASVEYSQVHGIAEQVLMQTLYNPARGVPVDEAAAASSVQRLQEKLDILNNILAKQQYLGGNEFSLIDAFFTPTVDQLFTAGQGGLFDERPNLKEWWNTVSSRDSWKKISA